MNHSFLTASVVTDNSVVINQLVTDFQNLPSWEQRYRRLIELGNELPRIASDDAQRDALCFRGCQSCVWLQTFLFNEAECAQNGSPRLHFLADSDSKINRGLIAILQRIYSGQPADCFLHADLNTLFAQLDLDQHLSAGRRNGLSDMERHLKEVARTVAYTA